MIANQINLLLPRHAIATNPKLPSIPTILLYPPQSLAFHLNNTLPNF